MNTDGAQRDNPSNRRRGGAGLAWSLVTAAAIGAAAIGSAAVAVAMEAPEPPVEAQAAQRVGESERLVDRLLGERVSPVRGLDPAIFIELSPVTASEPAVRLPEDQQDEE